MEQQDEQDEIVQEFLSESFEGLDQLDRELVELEEGGDPTSRLASIFRTIHSMKGTAGFLGYERLEKVAHAGETLLAKLRDGKLSLTKPIADALLNMVDAVRELLTQVQDSGAETGGEYEPLVERLLALAEGEAVPASKAAVVPLDPALVEEVMPEGLVPPAALKSRLPTSPEPASPRTAAEPEARAAESVAPLPPSPSEAEKAAVPAQPTASRGGAPVEASVRVDVALLDRLMNLVGELVLARNQLLTFAAGAEDPTFLAATQTLNHITSELQEGIMKTRMQPIGSVWGRLPRVVRDLASELGKQIKLETAGAETELDRTIIEAIRDPLTHILRNAADHGVESPAERTAKGKRPQGTIRLRAYHESGKVNVEVSDDGAGINTERIRQRAIERGVITHEAAKLMNESKLASLIFEPGFSTAQQVTNVSGRGVGMDVVKTNIERIGGRAEVLPGDGGGTTVRLKIPLTLAIVSALIVNVSEQRFAIPQVNLVELVWLDQNQLANQVEEVRGEYLYRLRGNLIPLVYLDRVLKLPGSQRDPALGMHILVLQADGRRFGLVVDDVLDNEEIVVKPLGPELKALRVYAGATIRGDGRVALILDVLGLAHEAHVLLESQIRGREAVKRTTGPTSAARESVLLCRSAEERIAIPLNLVTRLEEIDARAVERAAGNEVVQYHGEIMPLVRLSRLLGQESVANDAPIQVVVYADHDHSVGLVVDEVEDIIDQESMSVRKGTQGSLFDSAVVRGKVTDLLDLRALAESGSGTPFAAVGGF
ncbi:MAG: chemotaxis protein CheW [Myxococcales bacterium]|nr:chemotaxis protein CheW [Myxococcales bacterium]